MSETRKTLSNKASKKLVFGLIVVSLFLAFLAAFSIIGVSRNEAFQEEVKEMRRMYDPNYQEDNETTADSLSTLAPDSVSIN